MDHTTEFIGEIGPQVTFGQRKVRPRVCIVDKKPHIRGFLTEALEELGFISLDAPPTDDLKPAVDAFLPDLVLIGLADNGAETCLTLEALARWRFDGHVLLAGPLAMPVAGAAQRLGEKLGLKMLQTLGTPFGLSTLKERVDFLLPADEPQPPPVDVAEALHAGWLELWYQPKIDAGNLSVSGAEALIRMRHPTWGILSPACFIPAPGDPHFLAFSEFVVGQALADWHFYLGKCGQLQLAINLPLSFLESPDALASLSRQMPRHPAFEGLIVEIGGAEIADNLAAIGDLARKLQRRNIGVSVDNLGAEWPSLMQLEDFPFAEIKLAREFVSGCADQRLKRAVCRQIIDHAGSVGARVVAEGVETLEDFFALRDMGVTQIQGFLFGKPMTRQKFARDAQVLGAEAGRKVRGSLHQLQ